LNPPQIINGEVGHFQHVISEPLSRVLAELETLANYKDEEGRTTAIVSCAKYSVDGGSIRLLQLALDHGANAELADNSGQTPLIHCVIWLENYECAAVLVRHGVVLDAFDMYGCTALWYASGFGYLSTLQLLVQSGADIGRADNRGLAPIFMARMRGHTAVVAYLTIEGNWKRRRYYATMLNSLKGAPTISKIMRVFQCYDLARMIGTYL